jgi:hypothetical protein
LGRLNLSLFVRQDFAASHLVWPSSRFLSVLSEKYATQIAYVRDQTSGFAGYVLRFSVRTEFLKDYEVHVLGSSDHREYWIPASDLQKFNDNIVGAIEIIAEFPSKK